MEAAIHVVDLLEAKGELEVAPPERETRSTALGLGLDPARARIRFLGPSGKLRGELIFGERAPGGEWVARSSVSDRIWLLDPLIDDVFPLSPEAFETDWRRAPAPEGE